MTFKELCDALICNWDIPIPMETHIQIYIDNKDPIRLFDIHALSNWIKIYDIYLGFSVYEIKWIIDESIFIAKIRKEEAKE